MEHRFNRKQCHTELATFIVQRSIVAPVCHWLCQCSRTFFRSLYGRMRRPRTLAEPVAHSYRSDRNSVKGFRQPTLRFPFPGLGIQLLDTALAVPGAFAILGLLHRFQRESDVFLDLEVEHAGDDEVSPVAVGVGERDLRLDGPAAMTLKATQGLLTLAMKAAVSSGLLHHMLSKLALWLDASICIQSYSLRLSAGVADQ